MSNSNDSRGFLAPLLTTLLFAAIGIGFAIYGSGDWAPELASRHGAGIDAMMNFLLTATGAMFLIGHLVLAALIWQGARRTNVSMRLATPRTERIVAITLGLVMAFAAEGGVLAIGIPVFQEYYGEIPEDAVLVEITGQQFAWNVRYPGEDGILGRTEPALITLDNPIGMDPADPANGDDRFFINQITVPIGRPVHLQLRARDVIHSFFLPHFRLKQDAVPGMVIDVWFMPTRTGSFEIPCTELCGLGHYRMEALLRVVSEDEFAQFMQTATAD